MKKRTKKILSMVLSAAMTLSLAAGLPVTGASADSEDDHIQYDGPVNWSAGENGDCRIQIYNPWATNAKDGTNELPKELKGLTATKVVVSFKVSNVTKALAAVGKKQAIATSDSSFVGWSTYHQVTEESDSIKADGTYSVIFSDKEKYSQKLDEGQSLVLYIKAFDGLYEKDKTVGTKVKDAENAPVISDVTVKVIDMNKEGIKTTAPEATPAGDTTATGNAAVVSPGATTGSAAVTSPSATAATTEAPTSTPDSGKAEPTVEPTIAPTEEPSKEEDPSVAENNKVWETSGTHAYVYYQTSSWDYRNDMAAAEGAKDKNDPFSEVNYRHIRAAGEDVSKTAKVKDIVIDKDGTYTVSVSGIDLSGADNFTQLGISTDYVVPSEEVAAAKAAAEAEKEYNDWSVSVSDVTVKVDGTEVNGLSKVELPHNAESKYFLFTAANIWSENAKIPYNKNVDALGTLPTNSIEITFTISGISKAAADTPAATAKAPAKGKSFTVGNFKYKVTKAATAKANGKVTLTGLSKKGKKKSKLTVGTKVTKVKGFAITAIGKKAFKGAKATTITLNKKITKIPASAFANCKKLKTLKLKAKLKSVKKNAFKGCKKTITVKGTGKKANVKKLKKSGYKKFK